MELELERRQVWYQVEYLTHSDLELVNLDLELGMVVEMEIEMDMTNGITIICLRMEIFSS